MRVWYRATFLNGRAETEWMGSLEQCVSIARTYATHFLVWRKVEECSPVLVGRINLRGLE